MDTELFIGCDVSKGYADFLAVGRDAVPAEAAFRLEDTPQGHRQLKTILQGWVEQGAERLHVGVESTGGYENNWIRLVPGWADELPVRIARLNPAGVRSLRKASLTRTVTDAVSAEVIARYVLVFPEKVTWLTPGQAPGNELAAARKFHRSTATLDKQRQQLANQLEKLMYEYFPSLMVYTRRGIPRWLIALLSKYPSPESFRRAGKRRLSAIKGITMAKAEAVLGKLSAGDPQPGFLDRENIRQTARQIQHLQGLIEQRHKMLQAEYVDDRQVELLRSMPGVGLQTAVLLRIEIEEVRRFATAKKLATYFGVCPKYVESGDKKGQIRMSKQGRPEVRKALYMSGLTAIRRDESFKKLYHRYRRQGHNHYQAIGVVMHKLLRVAYGILYHQSPYDPAVDKANQRRASQKQRDKQEDQKKTQSQQKVRLNRYQNQTVTAPRSRRSVQKIKKEQSASQSSTVEECTGSPTAPQDKVYENVS
ncbi:MAG: IS110 family transposase [Balneolaceae bacterium]|nr:IS110 family transposase [Balneolaceae bacterium]